MKLHILLNMIAKELGAELPVEYHDYPDDDSIPASTRGWMVLDPSGIYEFLSEDGYKNAMASANDEGDTLLYTVFVTNDYTKLIVWCDQDER